MVIIRKPTHLFWDSHFRFSVDDIIIKWGLLLLNLSTYYLNEYNTTNINWIVNRVLYLETIYKDIIMIFFVPIAKNLKEAENVYISIAENNKTDISDRRVWKLKWKHNEMDMACKIGKPMPEYFQTRDEPVLAIYEMKGYFVMCTPSRGVLNSDPIIAGNGFSTNATYFDD